MPSPVGHALGGIAAGWALAPRRDRLAAAAIAAAAIAPDLDLVFGTHREASHSVGAAVIAGVAATIAVRFSGGPSSWRRALRWGGAIAIAWLSHVLFDWLSNDTRPPIGVMALWPFTHAYYKAALEIFPPVSRRYWETRFWIYNLRAVVIEVAVLGPIAAVVLWWGRRGH